MGCDARVIAGCVGAIDHDKGILVSHQGLGAVADLVVRKQQGAREVCLSVVLLRECFSQSHIGAGLDVGLNVDTVDGSVAIHDH